MTRMTLGATASADCEEIRAHTGDPSDTALITRLLSEERLRVRRVVRADIVRWAIRHAAVLSTSELPSPEEGPDAIQWWARERGFPSEAVPDAEWQSIRDWSADALAIPLDFTLDRRTIREQAIGLGWTP